VRSGDQFVRKFNELENILRRKAGLNKHRSFSKLVDAVANIDQTVRRRKNILKSFGRLRNAIVHDPEYPERILADPRPEILNEFDRVIAAIAAPQKLIPRFQKEIRVFTVDESLAECLMFMEENDFSQVVVLDGGKYGLLSSEGIVGWLRSARDIGLADLESASIKDALKFEDKEACRYLSREDPVDAAIGAFEEAIANGIPRLQAILVTETGRPEERPLGIVTPWDLLDLVSRNELA
jgi:CBS domain-containing protein